MAHIIFFEKPGCGANARQKVVLRQAGHTLDERSLLTWPWTVDSLLAFLETLPVPQWFNRSAPRIKTGEIDPDHLCRDDALCLLLAEPLLIRRPLMQLGDTHHVGFDTAAVATWAGLATDALHEKATLEGCAAAHERCPPPS